ncbi:MAG: hypothetical protein ABW133_20625 [Polyangiaceae bacterium]
MSSPDRAAPPTFLVAAKVVAAAFLLALFAPRTAAAAPENASQPEPNPETSRQRLRAITEPGPFFHTWASLMLGDGLRFNNPYRLPHQLGDSSESLSLTAPYVDVAIAVAAGNPTGLLHGGRLSWSVAMTGVPQGVVTPAYLVGIRPSGAWLLAAWAGVPLVTAPDFNVGGELAALATYFVRAGIGATAAIVADGFYGAGTRERRAALYPVVSAQLGISVDYEVLP